MDPSRCSALLSRGSEGLCEGNDRHRCPIKPTPLPCHVAIGEPSQLVLLVSPRIRTTTHNNAIITIDITCPSSFQASQPLNSIASRITHHHQLNLTLATSSRRANIVVGRLSYRTNPHYRSAASPLHRLPPPVVKLLTSICLPRITYPRPGHL